MYNTKITLSIMWSFSVHSVIDSVLHWCTVNFTISYISFLPFDPFSYCKSTSITPLLEVTKTSVFTSLSMVWPFEICVIFT